MKFRNLLLAGALTCAPNVRAAGPVIQDAFVPAVCHDIAAQTEEVMQSPMPYVNKRGHVRLNALLRDLQKSPAFQEVLSEETPMESMLAIISDDGLADKKRIRKKTKTVNLVQEVENPNAPVILLIEDIHGTPEVDKERLRTLKDDFGINSIALEGWVGTAGDMATGTRFLNAEEELVGQILSDPDWNCLGMEDVRLREEAYLVIYTAAYLDFIYYTALTSNKRESGEQSLEDLLNSLRLRKSESILKGMGERIQKMRGGASLTPNALLDEAVQVTLGIAPTTFAADFSKKFFNYRSQASAKFTEVVEVQRSKKGAEKLKEALKSNPGLKTIAVMFGAGHRESFLAEFRGEDVNILVYDAQSSDMRADDRNDIAMQKIATGFSGN